MAGRHKEFLDEGYVEARHDFGGRGTVWDTKVAGLQIRCGARKFTWAYVAEYRLRGKRGTIFKRLGFWPAMSVIEARKLALQEAGRVAARHLAPGRRDAMTVQAAIAEYIEHLEAQAAKRGKKATWARLARTLTAKHLLPEFGNWSLAELSAAPALVKDWHAKVSRTSPVSANRVASVLSAAYRNAARLDRTLPPHSPTSAVRMNAERAAQSAMPFDQFAAWGVSVAALPPIRAAFYRFCLLTGMRSGEAARLEWRDVDWKARTVTVRAAKAGANIVVPLSSAIARELNRARHGGQGDRIFPNVKNWNDALPFKGHDLRHSWRSVAADLGVDELQARLLLGHSLVGISQSYVTRAVLTGGPGLRAAQRKISQRIVELLGTKL